MDRARRLFDLSHPIVEHMTTNPGLPGPELSDHLTRAAAEARYGRGVTFSIGRVSMVGNTGTYVDSPFHRHADGTDLAGLPLERLADVPGGAGIPVVEHLCRLEALPTEGFRLSAVPAPVERFATMPVRAHAFAG